MKEVQKAFGWSFGIFFLVLSAALLSSDVIGLGIVLGIIGVIPIILVSRPPSKEKKPILDSYFRLMLSGGDRQFLFNKSDETSVKIADFINKVEETLTAYK